MTTEADTALAVQCGQSSCGATHRGRVRAVNEDRVLVAEPEGVYLVADGMGGHNHGDIASATIVEAVEERLGKGARRDPADLVIGAVQAANRRIRRIAAARDNAMMGSTVAALALADGRYAVIWTGDSRIYRVRNGGAEQLTTDHSEAQMLLQRGSISREQFESWPRKNVIMHAVGIRDDVHIEVSHGTVNEGDRFVICSDGLTAHLDDRELGEMARTGSARQTCTALMEAALRRGGTDNIGVIVVHCNGEHP